MPSYDVYKELHQTSFLLAVTSLKKKANLSMLLILGVASITYNTAQLENKHAQVSRLCRKPCSSQKIEIYQDGQCTVGACHITPLLFELHNQCAPMSAVFRDCH